MSVCNSVRVFVSKDLWNDITHLFFGTFHTIDVSYIFGGRYLYPPHNGVKISFKYYSAGVRWLIT